MTVVDVLVYQFVLPASRQVLYSSLDNIVFSLTFCQQKIIMLRYIVEADINTDGPLGSLRLSGRREVVVPAAPFLFSAQKSGRKNIYVHDSC